MTLLNNRWCYTIEQFVRVCAMIGIIIIIISQVIVH